MIQTDFIQKWTYYTSFGDSIRKRWIDSDTKKKKRKKHIFSDRFSTTRSLYFKYESDDEIGLTEESFRIRYYNNDLSFIRLEKKWKSGNVYLKQSTTISQAECEGLLNGDISFLKSSENVLYLELYAKMHYNRLKPHMLVNFRHDPIFIPRGLVNMMEAKEYGGRDVICAFLDHSLPQYKVFTNTSPYIQRQLV